MTLDNISVRPLPKPAEFERVQVQIVGRMLTLKLSTKVLIE